MGNLDLKIANKISNSRFNDFGSVCSAYTLQELEEGLDNPHGRLIITGNSKSAYSRVSTLSAWTCRIRLAVLLCV